ncbi:MAG: DNRLRE domain-containing protein [Acidobacteria bacterium]|nr:DNRLRE domain-containing protein [Acidobacteriota bacterium]
MRKLSKLALFLCLLLILSSLISAEILKPEDVEFKDVDVYEYSYRNWDNANWAQWSTLGVYSSRGTRRRTYISFDVNKLKAKTSNLNKVELVFQGYVTTGSKAKINIYRIKEAWNAGTGTYHSGQVEPNARAGEITWNKQPEWDAEKVWSHANTENKKTAPIRFDITELVKSWVSGKNENYGLVIICDNELNGTAKLMFNSSETTKPELLPTIQVNEKGDIAEIPGKCQNLLWGTQIAGSGHMKNAKVNGNRIILERTGKIVSQKGDHAGYSIWSGGKSILTVRKGASAVGCTLPAGQYQLLAGIGDKLQQARVELCIEDLGTNEPRNDCTVVVP